MYIEGMGDSLDLTGEFARQTRLDGFMDILANLSEQGLVQFNDHENGLFLQLTRRVAAEISVHVIIYHFTLSIEARTVRCNFIIASRNAPALADPRQEIAVRYIQHPLPTELRPDDDTATRFRKHLPDHGRPVPQRTAPQY